MRIAIYSDNFYPELSGLSDSIMTTGRELGRLGHQVRFFVPRYSADDYELIKLPEKEPDLGKNVSVVRFPSFHGKSGTGQGRAVVPMPFGWHKSLEFKPDIIHTNLFFGVGLEALIAAKKLKVPLVGTNHTALVERMFLPYAPFHSKKLVEWLIRYAVWYYNKCDFVTTPSRVVLDEMRHLGFKKEGHVISNPIDTDMFKTLPNKNWLKKKFGLPEETIVHAGRLAKERSIDVILKAVAIVKKEIPKIHLALAGKGAYEKELKGLAVSLGIESNISFLGFLDKPVLAEVYNASKVFVITSTSDTQSMVMMQAMACGLPIIAVKEGGPADYVNKTNGFLVEPGDEKALTKKMVQFLKNPALRKDLGEGARIFATKFSAPEIAKEWEEIYAIIHHDYNKGDAYQLRHTGA